MQVMPVALPISSPQIEESKNTQSNQSFGDVLNNAIKEVNDAQVRADETTQSFLSGEIQDIHQVTIAMEEAKLMMHLAVEVRNKVIEAYQEISRMQV